MDNEMVSFGLNIAGKALQSVVLFGAVAWTMAWINQLAMFHAQITIKEKASVAPQYVYVTAILWAIFFFLANLL